MPKRRLLFYTHGLVGGGGERVWALVASGLQRRGHDVSFAVDFVAKENEHLLVPEMRRHVLGKGHGTAVVALKGVLREERPDAAFAAIGASNLKLIAAKALSGWKGAAVLSAHGRLDAEPHFLGRTTYAATALTSRLAARTIVVSDDLRRYLIDRFHARADRIVTIHNGIALPGRELVPDARMLAARENIVLGVGRLVPEKGFATLIDAFSRSKLARRLVLTGEGPQRGRLEDMIAERKVTDRVELRGYIKDLAPIYAQGKMLALPSRSEAFGNVIVEALSYGLPVVATHSGGPDEILESGRYGRLVAVDAVEALARAIDETLADPGDPACHRARAEDFSLERALDHFERLIEEVVEEQA